MIQGKTKTLEPFEDGLRVTTKDSLTANDAAKRAEANVAAYKTRQTCSVFEFLNNHNIPTHYIKKLDDTSFLVKECDMIPIECVARSIAYGSFLKRHPNAESGKHLPWTNLEFFHKLAYIKESNELIPEDEAREKYMRQYNPADGEWITEVITDPFIMFNWEEWKEHAREETDKKGFKIQFYNPKSPLNIEDPLIVRESDISPKTYDTLVDHMGNIFNLLAQAWRSYGVELVDIKLEFGYLK